MANDPRGADTGSDGDGLDWASILAAIERGGDTTASIAGASSSTPGTGGGGGGWGLPGSASLSSQTLNINPNVGANNHELLTHLAHNLLRQQAYQGFSPEYVALLQQHLAAAGVSHTPQLPLQNFQNLQLQQLQALAQFTPGHRPQSLPPQVPNLNLQQHIQHIQTQQHYGQGHAHQTSTSSQHATSHSRSGSVPSSEPTNTYALTPSATTHPPMAIVPRPSGFSTTAHTPPPHASSAAPGAGPSTVPTPGTAGPSTVPTPGTEEDTEDKRVRNTLACELLFLAFSRVLHAPNHT